MADWPTVGEVKAALNVNTTARDAVIASAVGAAIEQVCHDLGYRGVTVTTPNAVPAATGWVEEYDDSDEDETPAAIVPSYSMENAALILAVMTVKAPDAPYGVAAVFDTGGLRVAAQHPTYRRLLTGNRVAFGVA